MKHKIERTNPSTKRFSTRTIAMVLSIVMLIGSIATGSMLSTFAAYLKDAAKADAVTQAAAEGGNIALNAIPSEDSDAAVDTDKADAGDKSSDESFVDDIEDGYTLSKKVDSDLAVTGNNADTILYVAVPKNWTEDGYTTIWISAQCQTGNDNYWNDSKSTSDTYNTHQGYRIFSITLNSYYYDGWANMYLKGKNSSGTTKEIHIQDTWKGASEIGGKCNFTAVSGNINDWGDYEYDSNWYISGYLGKHGTSGQNNVNSQSPDYELTKGTGTNVNKWSYSYMANGTQYVTINMKDGWGNSKALHPASNNAASGTIWSTTDTTYSGSSGYKWKINATDGQIVTVTFDTWTHKVSWTVSDPVYSVWGGDKVDLDHTSHLVTLTYNSTTHRYDGQYTLASTNYHSMLISGNPTPTEFSETYRVWTSYPSVYWALDTYNNNQRYGGYDSSSKQTMTDGALSFVEVNNNGKSWGIKLAARTANTTIQLSFDPSDGTLYIHDAEVTSATIYAKDGAINNSSTSQTYASIANTKIYKANGTTAAGTNTTVTGQQSYETYTAQKGETVVIKTTIGHNATGGNLSDATTLRSKYYVRGFCINGEVLELLTPNTSTGEYTLTYKVPEDYEGGAIEITPIYYLVNTTTYPIVTFRVNGFTDNLKEVGAGKPNWGNTLYAYPFYGKLGGYNNAFGSYPGQPLVYNNGQYQIQIPTKSTAWAYDSTPDNTKGATNITQVRATPVSGVTMSNGYYDNVHRTIMGYGDDSTSTDHVQTYDYGDFYKIQQEHDPDNIVFDFKYETKKHNLTDQITGTTTVSALTSKYGDTNGNGFELLKNYHGKNVDLFGTALNGDTANPEITDPVYVVSIGGIDTTNQIGVENIAGYYATEWIVYAKDGSSYKRITNGKTSIPPEVLLLNDNTSASFSTTKYPSAVAEGSSSTYNYAITDWQPLYTTLEAYRNHPVYISYEKAATQLGAKNHTSEVGANGATRNDGRWLYSSKGENITSSIKIQYSNDNGVNYTDLDTASPQVSGLSAYFTNSEAYGEQTYATTIDADKTFDFEASTTNANYMFVGWYFDNGIKITTDNAGSTERSGSYTLVARFMKVTAGQLILQHSTNTDNTYKGAGTSKIAVQVTDADDNELTSYETADTITIPKRYITNTHLEYKIKVRLTSTPTGYDTYGTTSLDTTESSVTTAKFFNNVNTTTSGNVTTKTFEFTVGDLFSGSDQVVNSLLYNSYYNKTTFNYDITFNYTGRKINTENANRSYKRSGTLTPAQVTSYVTKSGSTYTLNQDFITTLAPHESNFNETLVWTLGNVTSNTTSFTASYTAKVATTGTKIRSAARTATFDMGKGGANEIYNVTYGQLIKNGDNYITAEPMYNGKYFQYWRIQTANADPTKRIDVAKCYSNDFNYLAYDNYYITAVYDETPFSYGSDGASASISYLDTTRNQWNNGGNGGYTTSVAARNTASDLLFNDFALAYGYNGNRLYESNNAVAGNAVEVGFVVERIRNLDIKQDGSYDTDVSKYIASGTDADAAKDNATAAINNITVSGYGAANGTNDYKTFTKYKLDRTKLDNKNRIEFFYALYNAYGGGTNGTGTGTDGDYWKNLTYKNYVYRAYSYIKVGDTLTVTNDPAYFIMYDEATK